MFCSKTALPQEKAANRLYPPWARWVGELAPGWTRNGAVHPSEHYRAAAQFDQVVLARVNVRVTAHGEVAGLRSDFNGCSDVWSRRGRIARAQYIKSA